MTDKVGNFGCFKVQIFVVTSQNIHRRFCEISLKFHEAPSLKLEFFDGSLPRILKSP